MCVCACACACKCTCLGSVDEQGVGFLLLSLPLVSLFAENVLVLRLES